MVQDISSVRYHHPPIYNIKQFTVNVYKLDSGGYGQKYGLVPVYKF